MSRQHSRGYQSCADTAAVIISNTTAMSGNLIDPFVRFRAISLAITNLFYHLISSREQRGRTMTPRFTHYLGTAPMGIALM
jgi:hypothetical protein